jgi:hypothetical protein
MRGSSFARLIKLTRKPFSHAGSKLLSQREEKQIFDQQPQSGKLLSEIFSKNIIKSASLCKYFPSVSYGGEIVKNK